ncbi:hypothetical protein IM697_26420 [Streptomyces ferrugineus]|uniref:Uncharacterized protein n=1 Tax=Streptomyces ferrugineus TaxID=1413221 RepID=A0A7M2SBM5_9ACTN|nr:hypothetical protein [Streptomyces ferrugineus]QOV33724.1 hypothetical protein IM697_26420 [Streptomyces ferrugineus]
MTALAVTRATLARVLGDRTALFFMVLLPVAIIVVIGVTVSGFDQFRVGLVPAAKAGPVARELTTDLQEAPGLRTRTYDATHDACAALPRAGRRGRGANGSRRGRAGRAVRHRTSARGALGQRRSLGGDLGVGRGGGARRTPAGRPLRRRRGRRFLRGQPPPHP